METTEKTIWINLTEDEKLTILSNIAEEKGIKENAVEKDFWSAWFLRLCSVWNIVTTWFLREVQASVKAGG